MLSEIHCTSIGGVVTFWEAEKSDRITTPVGYASQTLQLRQQPRLMLLGLGSL